MNMCSGRGLGPTPSLVCLLIWGMLSACSEFAVPKSLQLDVPSVPFLISLV